MAFSLFNRGRGDISLRVAEPEGFPQTGTAAFVLGSDEPGWFGDLDNGDFISVWRDDLDVTGVDLLRARFRVRGPTANPSPSHVWRLQLLVDGGYHFSRDIRIGRTEDFFDVGVNVSKISGLHKFEIKLAINAS